MRLVFFVSTDESRRRARHIILVGMTGMASVPLAIGVYATARFGGSRSRTRRVSNARR